MYKAQEQGNHYDMLKKHPMRAEDSKFTRPLIPFDCDAIGKSVCLCVCVLRVHVIFLMTREGLYSILIHEFAFVFVSNMQLVIIMIMKIVFIYFVHITMLILYTMMHIYIY